MKTSILRVCTLGLVSPAILVGSVCLIKDYFELGWGLAVISGVAATIAIHFFTLCIIVGGIAFWAHVIYRGWCPNCETKNLRAGKKCFDAEDPDPMKSFMHSECDNCHWQFRDYSDGDLVSISPKDDRYWT